MGLTIRDNDMARRLLASAPVLALAAGAAYLFSDHPAQADVDDWPKPPNHHTNSTRRDSGGNPSSEVADPVNIVFFNYGQADWIIQKLNDPGWTLPPWQSCVNGGKQWLFVDDHNHTSNADNQAWVWASGDQNQTPSDGDGAGFNYTREGDCDDSGGADDFRYHARHFGRSYTSTDTPPQPPLYWYSLVAAHYEHCHTPFFSECSSVSFTEGHHVHSWNEARNRLWADISDQAWLDAPNSFSRQVGNQGTYQDQYHDTVFYLKACSSSCSSSGGGGK